MGKQQKSSKGSPARKGSSKSESARSYALSKKLSKEKENPFDKFANAKKKHEVVNRKVKGEDRNVGKARDKAIEERRKRLLGDYQRAKKTNVFNDRRFGEADADMSLEEKMFARFQKEKVKKARNLSQFNLDDGEDTEQLTHKGQVLSLSNVANTEDWSDNEEDANLNRDVVSNLHFGGGMVPKAKGSGGGGADGEGGDDSRGSRMDKQLSALQEIVMKSKEAKAQKKEAKEEQEQGREALDRAFEDLMSGNILGVNTMDDRTYKKNTAEAKKKDEFSEYDSNMMDMLHEAKVKASDRTKTPEEIALADRARLEEAEKERLKRAREGPDLSSAAKADAAGNTTFLNVAPEASKEAAATGGKRKRNSEPGIEGFDEGEGEEEDEDEEEDDEDDDDDDDDDDEDDDDDDEEEGNSEPASKSEAKPYPAAPVAVPVAKANKAKASQQKQQQLTVNDAMPHLLPCPPDLAAFRELTEKYVRHQEDYLALVERIVSYHSVKLPGQLGKDNRNNMHNFLGVLLADFSGIGDGLAFASNDTAAGQQHDLQNRLDGLTAIVFKVCSDMQESVASMWAKALSQMQQAHRKRLRDHAQGVAASTWPSLGKILFLRLLGHVYSVTDLQHALATPATLLLCQFLAQCPVRRLQDVSSGLLVCSVLIDFTADSRKLLPEVVAFLSRLLNTVTAVTASASASEDGGAGVGLDGSNSTFDLKRLSWMQLSTTTTTAAAAKKKSGGKKAAKNDEDNDGDDDNHDAWVPSKLPWQYFVPSESQEEGPGAVEALRLTESCLGLCKVLLGRHGDLDAFPEAVAPLLAAQLQLCTVVNSASHATATGDASTATAVKALVAHMKTVVTSSSAQVERKQELRLPLAWRGKGPAGEGVKAQNPLYAMNYTFKKDNDADAERAKMKQLQRQLKRETKAANRELRRDADFLDREAWQEKAASQKARRDERAKNFAFMEEQQATINQQVRMGGGLMKGGGNGQLKPLLKKQRRKN